MVSMFILLALRSFSEGGSGAEGLFNTRCWFLLRLDKPYLFC